MTGSEIAKCNGIIHAASLAAAGIGAGLAQIPGSDSLVLSGIQTAMTISLGAVFGIKLDESGAAALTASAVGSTVGRTVSQILVGWIPGVGNAINATTAAGITEALGWKIANEFDDRKCEKEQMA